MVTLNDDHTATVQVIDGDKLRDVVLRQPNMVELADLREMAWEADDSLPPLPRLSEPPTREELREFTEAVNQRDRVIFGRGAPYGKIMVATVNLLSDESIAMSDLPSDYLGSAPLKQVLDHFKTPLLGGASVTATNSNSDS